MWLIVGLVVLIALLCALGGLIQNNHDAGVHVRDNNSNYAVTVERQVAQAKANTEAWEKQGKSSNR